MSAQAPIFPDGDEEYWRKVPQGSHPAKRQRVARPRKCRFCEQKVFEQYLLTHEQQCVSSLRMDVRECALDNIRCLATSLENDEKRIVAVIGGLPPESDSLIVKDVPKVDILFNREMAEASSQGGVRTHQGFMAAMGWNHRLGRPHESNSPLAFATCHRMFSEAYKTSQVIKQYLLYAPDKEEMLVRNLRALSQDPGQITSPNVYWSKYYTRGDGCHEPPEPVAQFMSTWGNQVADCRLSCSTCRSHGCLRCELCSLHQDSKGITILIAYQQRKVTNPGTASLCLGAFRFSIAGGLIAIFDGSLIHGVFGRRNHSNSSMPWWVCALTCVD